jgi:N-acetylglucosamine kinase-like BadF-type ATPase
VRHSLDRFDRGQAEDALTTAVLSLCGASSPAGLIALFHRNADRRYWAELSRLVFDAAEGGHPESVALIERAGEHLACLTLTVADRLGMTGPVVLGGGLGTNQPALRGSFVRHLEGHGITDVRTLTVEPVYGALRLLRPDASMS